MNRPLKLHFICMALALLDILLFFYGRISFRGQWLDIILSFAPLITAVVAVCSDYRSLHIVAKIYLPVAIVINLLLAPIYFFGTIFYPQETQAESGPYEARDRMGMLAGPAVNLIYKWGPFEKMVSPNLDLNSEQRIRIVFKPDSVGVVLPGYNSPDTTYYFRDESGK